MLKHGMTRDRPGGPLFVGIFKPFIIIQKIMGNRWSHESLAWGVVSHEVAFHVWWLVGSTHGINRSTGGHEYWQASGEIL